MVHILDTGVRVFGYGYANHVGDCHVPKVFASCLIDPLFFHLFVIFYFFVEVLYFVVKLYCLIRYFCHLLLFMWFL